MIESLETLLALKQYKTMSQASHHLRISQSAVSKRIASLENEAGKKLTQKNGRYIELTPDALLLLEKVQPHLSEIREALSFQTLQTKSSFTLGVSDSILASWGPKYLNAAFKNAQLTLQVHCHRSPLVIEKVSSGIYDAGLCAGRIANNKGLHTEHLFMESMVLVSRQKINPKAPLSVTSIEANSSTWRSLKPNLNNTKITVENHLESFVSIAQMAQAGLCIGLVPEGVTSALKINASHIYKPKTPIKRPIQLVFKKSKLENEHFRLLQELLT